MLYAIIILSVILSIGISFYFGSRFGKKTILERWEIEKRKTEEEYSKTLTDWEIGKETNRKTYEAIIRSYSNHSLEPADFERLYNNFKVS